MGANLPKMSKLQRMSILSKMMRPHEPAIEPSLEKLPLELFLDIIKRVPEAALNLRLTSQALKALVDAYSMERSNKQYVSILYELRIISYHEQKTTPGRMIISMIIAQENSMELKMRLIRHSPGNILRIRKTLGTRDVFNFDCFASESSMMKYLRECFGMRIDNVEIVNCRDHETEAAILKLLKDIKVVRLNVLNSHSFCLSVQVVTMASMLPELNKSNESFKTSFSTIEELPSEVLWEIVEYTSRTMKWRVDEWEHYHRSIPIIEELKISDYQQVHFKNSRSQDTNICKYHSSLKYFKPDWMSLEEFKLNISALPIGRFKLQVVTMGSMLPTLNKSNELLISSLSIIEELPAEVICEIIEYVNDGVYNLRLTSRTMKCRVDQWALLHQSTRIVEELRIRKSAYQQVHFEHRRSQDTNIRLRECESIVQSTKPGWMALKILIPLGRNSKLFELRLIRESPQMFRGREKVYRVNENTIDFDARESSTGSSQFAICELLRGVQIDCLCIVDRSIQPSA
ncbi:hypothetical protein PRIPAC_87447, partial [Pristionchus pacificus]|uniref:F-box domain-containing protein n=1 Tax=Pristionchus pacificus TaxID=54126 RepID=A0A2A6B6F2_PRIPA